MEWNEHDDSNIFENGILSERHYVNEWLLDGNMLLKEYISNVTTHVISINYKKNEKCFRLVLPFWDEQNSKTISMVL